MTGLKFCVYITSITEHNDVFSVNRHPSENLFGFMSEKQPFTQTCAILQLIHMNTKYPAFLHTNTTTITTRTLQTTDRNSPKQPSLLDQRRRNPTK
jgi:hypothetical protein